MFCFLYPATPVFPLSFCSLRMSITLMKGRVLHHWTMFFLTFPLRKGSQMHVSCLVAWRWEKPCLWPGIKPRTYQSLRGIFWLLQATENKLYTVNVICVPNHREQERLLGKEVFQQTPHCKSHEMCNYNHSKYFNCGHNKELKCSLQFPLQHLSTPVLLSLFLQCLNLDVMWNQDNFFCCLFQRHLLFSAH